MSTSIISVCNNTLTLQGDLSGILTGDRAHIEGAGTSTTRTVAEVNGNTVTVDGEAMPGVDPVRVFIGPHFDYTCYLSAQKYGYKPQEKASEIDLVADDVTAWGVIARDFDDIPAQIAVERRKTRLYRKAHQILTTPDTGDGAHYAAEKCISILMHGGSISDASSALDERIADLQWV